MRTKYRKLQKENNDYDKQNFPIRVKLLNNRIVELNEQIFNMEQNMGEK